VEGAKKIGVDVREPSLMETKTKMKRRKGYGEKKESCRSREKEIGWAGERGGKAVFQRSWSGSRGLTNLRNRRRSRTEGKRDGLKIRCREKNGRRGRDKGTGRSDLLIGETKVVSKNSRERKVGAEDAEREKGRQMKPVLGGKRVKRGKLRGLRPL